MAGSEVEIVNMAASRIGITDLLTDDGTDLATLALTKKPLAQQGSLWYAKKRDEVLRRFRWPFATVRAALTIAPSVTRTDWDYVYLLPADCLTVRAITVDGNRNPQWNEVPPHRIEARYNAGRQVVGRVLLCDVEAAELVYTSRVEDPGLFPGDFENALAERLAAELALSIPKSPELALTKMKEFERLLWVAAAAAANEEAPDQDEVSSFEKARN
jgi:hypothetical protein